MSKVAYLECPTGIAGDMCLGALVSVGVPLDYLTTKLDGLGIAEEYRLKAAFVQRNGQQATKIEVELKDSSDTPRSQAEHSHTHKHPSHKHSSHEHPHAHEHSHTHETSAATGSRLRHLPEIEQMIQGADLPPRAESWSLAIFRQLAAAEGAVHGISPEQVHFHEVGAIDAIVDIVGTCLGLDWLEIDHLYCSALPTGGGTVWAAHGRLPVPVPAVLKLYEMRQVPLYSNGIERELVTPTGAAIATTLSTKFGSPPTMTLQKVGLGAGSIDLPIPNILRLWIGETAGEKLEKANHLPTQKPGFQNSNNLDQPSISVLETQIDDLNPQAIGYVFEALFAVGALDVFTQAIGMKKSRPGVLLTVICSVEKVADCERVLFRETSTLGIRHSLQQRSTLQREFHKVETMFGVIQVKVARNQEGTIINVQPEYEDCAQIARHHHIAWREIHQIALQNWHQQNQDH
ncbi:nickel pincer cofactor biosynthesis protein LarC [Phormidesmis sp. 146-12]